MQDSLYVIRSEIGYQCSAWRSGLVCSCREDLRINLFAVNLIHILLTAPLHFALLLAVNFEAVLQQLVRKLIISVSDSAPRSCVLDPIPTTLLKTYLDDFVPLIFQNCERITVV